MHDQNGHQAAGTVAEKDQEKAKKPRKPKPEIDVRTAAVAAAVKEVAKRKRLLAEAEDVLAGEQKALADCVKLAVR